MKVLCIVLCALAAASGSNLHLAPAVAETGASAQFRSEDNLGNYNFGYNEDHTSGGTFRREVGDAHGNVAGSYGLRDADGRIRIVNYVANDDGFKADIQTNEPGVEPKDPADATINKAESVIVQAAVEPVVAVPAATEPLAYAFPEPALVPVAADSRPLTYTFPEPAVVPVAKGVAAPAPVLLSAPVAEPVRYAFPAPSAVPVAKGIAAPAPVLLSTAQTVAVAQPAPLTYAFPAPAAVPVAKGVAVAQPAPLTYAFPAPAAVPVAKGVALAQPAPLPYAFPAPAAVPVAKGFAVAQPTSKFAYSSQVVVNNAPGVAVAYPQHAHGYALAPFHGANLSPYHGAFRYASPYYRSLYSPVVSTFAGPVPYFNNIEYHGYPVVKK